MINYDKYDLEKSFKEILYKIDNWVNEGSAWIIESMNGEYVNMSVYSLLSGISFLKLPNKLKNTMKDLINILKNDNKCFLRCHIRHLNTLKTHSERKAKADENMVNDLDYEGIKFPVSKSDYSKIEQKNHICINAFYYENNLVHPVYVSDQKFEDHMDVLLISNKNNSHYVYIKDFNRFMSNKTKCRTKKYFCKYRLQCFSSGKILQKHKETCLKINGKQNVKLKSGSIKFENHFKQLAVPFKIYVKFLCNVKEVKSNDKKNNASYT